MGVIKIINNPRIDRGNGVSTSVGTGNNIGLYDGKIYNHYNISGVGKLDILDENNEVKTVTIDGYDSSLLEIAGSGVSKDGVYALVGQNRSDNTIYIGEIDVTTIDESQIETEGYSIPITYTEISNDQDIYFTNNGDLAFDGGNNLWVYNWDRINSGVNYLTQIDLSAHRLIKQINLRTNTGETMRSSGGLAFSSDGKAILSTGYIIDLSTGIARVMNNQTGNLTDFASSNWPMYKEDVPTLELTSSPAERTSVYQRDSITYKTTVTTSPDSNLATTGARLKYTLPEYTTYKPNSIKIDYGDGKGPVAVRDSDIAWKTSSGDMANGFSINSAGSNPGVIAINSKIVVTFDLQVARDCPTGMLTFNGEVDLLSQNNEDLNEKTTNEYYILENSLIINTKDHSIYYGENWAADDLFVSALDKDGNDLQLNDLNVATSPVRDRVGEYTIDFNYQNIDYSEETAKLTILDNPINLDANGGTIPDGKGGTPTTYTIENNKIGSDVSLSEYEPTRENYTFQHWEDEDGTKYTNTIEVPKTGKSLTAVWAPNQKSATVTYIDDTTGTDLLVETLTGPYGTTSDYRTTDQIKIYTDAGYELVSNNYPAGGVVFDQNGNVVKEFEVHLTHKTESRKSTHKVTRTINHEYANGDPVSGFEDEVQEIEFSIDWTYDFVTKNTVPELTDARWAATDPTFVAYTAPGLTGYTPAPTEVSAVTDVTADTEDITETVVYTANEESATVTYIDDVTGDTLHVENLTGSYGTTSDYRTTDQIKTYTDANYELVSDNYPEDGVVFDQAGVVQAFEVHLTHKTESRTNTHKITRTINHEYANGDPVSGFEDEVQEIEFSIDWTYDFVTKNTVPALTDARWTATDPTFAAYTAPTLTGFTPNPAEVPIVENVKANTDDITEKVIYNANEESATVTYIDDTTGDTLHVENLVGSFGTTSDYRTAEKIKEYTDAGHEFVSDNYPTDGVVFNQAGVVQEFVVHLKHTFTETKENHTVNQTIHYQYENQTEASPDYTASLTFERTATKDNVTKEVSYSDWTATDGTSFEAVDSPLITGYTPDRATVDAIENVTGTTEDQVTTVTYIANQQSATVTYIDDTTGDTLHVDTPTGPYGTTSDYRTETLINNYAIAGYEKVSDNYPADGVVFDQDGIVQAFEVHFEHVNFDKTETKTVSQTIHYLYEDGKEAKRDYIATLTFSRVLTTDEVTGDVTKGEWIAINGTNIFAAVTSPTIVGYTPYIAVMPEVPNIDGDSENIEETVTYKVNEQTATVTYIDDTTGETLFIKHLSGPYGTTSDYRTANQIKSYTDTGYELYSDDYPANGVVFDQDGVVKRYEVHLKHGVKRSTQNKTVKETIHYVYEDGSTAKDDYTATLRFNRTVTTDLVAGQPTYGDWVAENGTTFVEVKSPVIKGYTADKLKIDAVENVTGDTPDIEETVTYIKNATSQLPTTGSSTSDPSASGGSRTTQTTRSTIVNNPPTTSAVAGASRTTQNSLPKTGEEGSQYLIILGFTFLVMGGGMILVKKERKDKTQ